MQSHFLLTTTFETGFIDPALTRQFQFRPFESLDRFSKNLRLSLPCLRWVHILSPGSVRISQSSLDYNTFADPLFDANEYANAILAGEKYRPSQSKRTSKSVSTTNEGAKEDISVALAKLSFGIEDVSKQLKTVVGLLSSVEYLFIGLTFS